MKVNIHIKTALDRNIFTVRQEQMDLLIKSVKHRYSREEMSSCSSIMISMDLPTHYKKNYYNCFAKLTEFLKLIHNFRSVVDSWSCQKHMINLKKIVFLYNILSSYLSYNIKYQKCLLFLQKIFIAYLCFCPLELKTCC